MSESSAFSASTDSEKGIPIDDLLPVIYDDLRKLAAKKLAREKPGHTLQATALVHESFLRLKKSDHLQLKNTRHFYAAAATAMQRLLVDRARQKKRIKHGGTYEKIALDELEIQCALPSDTLLEVNEALDKLARFDGRAAEFVRLRFFTGLDQNELAEHFSVSRRTADKIWAFARAWLYRELEN